MQGNPGGKLDPAVDDGRRYKKNSPFVLSRIVKMSHLNSNNSTNVSLSHRGDAVPATLPRDGSEMVGQILSRSPTNWCSLTVGNKWM